MANDVMVVPEFSAEKLDLLKRTICKGASDDEFQLFTHICKRTGLDPFAKQIYAIKRKTKNDVGQWIEQMSYQTGIDGYRLTASRTGEHGGTTDPAYTDCSSPLCQDCKQTEGHPLKAVVTVYRIVKGVRCDWTASALWKEYRQTKGDGTLNKFWRMMPHGQLGKCAEALALRKAFPAELSGVYTHDEMGQADNGKESDIPIVAMPKRKTESSGVVVAPPLPAPTEIMRVQTTQPGVVQLVAYGAASTVQPLKVGDVVIGATATQAPTHTLSQASQAFLDEPDSVMSEQPPEPVERLGDVIKSELGKLAEKKKAAPKREVDWSKQYDKGLISIRQNGMVCAIRGEAVKSGRWTEEDVLAMLTENGYEHTDQIKRGDFTKICEWLKPGSTQQKKAVS